MTEAGSAWAEPPERQKPAEVGNSSCCSSSTETLLSNLFFLFFFFFPTQPPNYLACSDSNTVWCSNIWFYNLYSPQIVHQDVSTHVLSDIATFELQEGFSSYITAQSGLQDVQITANTSQSQLNKHKWVLPPTCSCICAFFSSSRPKIIKSISQLCYWTCHKNPKILWEAG